VRFRRQAVVESRLAIGAIPEAFFALLARSKSKSNQHTVRSAGDEHAYGTPQRLSFQIKVF
jgi:hypothetical protein